MTSSKTIRYGLIPLLLCGVCAGATAGETRIAGKLYADATVRSTDGSNADDGYGIDVKRFYFGAEHTFDEVWSANFTTDFHYNSSDGRTSLFVKKAYVQANLRDIATVRLGSADLPWVPYVEGVYGLRYLENVMIDRTGFGTSADWGMHVLGKNGRIDYQVSVVNGNGYANPDRSKSMDVSGRVGFRPIDGLTVAAGFRSGKLGQDSETVSTTNRASRADALVAWKGGNFSVGAEYFRAKNYTRTAVITGPEDTASGGSLFASYDLGNARRVFARFESVKPSRDLDSSQEDNYANVGYAFSPTGGVTFALAYKQREMKAAGSSTTSREFGLWTEVKF